MAEVQEDKHQLLEMGKYHEKVEYDIDDIRMYEGVELYPYRELLTNNEMIRGLNYNKNESLDSCKSVRGTWFSMCGPRIPTMV